MESFKKTFSPILLLLIESSCFFLLFGCGSGFKGGKPSVAQVEVNPSTGSLEIGQSLQITAIGRDNQGALLEGVPFNWKSTDPEVAEITPKGPNTAEVLAKKEGAVTVIALAPGGQFGVVTLVIKPTAPPSGPPTPPPPALTFQKDIKPLTQVCSACHPALLPNSGPMDDYKNITSKGFVKPGDPDNSSYYLKPAGKVPHGGGSAWGANAQKVYDWIKAGAPE